DDVRDALIATPGAAFELAKRDSGDRSLFPDKKEARESLKDDAEAINELQDKLYANRDRALLVVLQGMDTAGKSGTIKSVFSRTSPLGMNVKAFKAPSKEELAHDYLWRVHNAVPRFGHIGIFDRSHYEDVLVVRVRGFAPEDAIEQRYDQINAFEKHLTENGVVILKCMLNVSYDEQRERLQERLDKPHKQWKFNPGDLEDRERWPEFMDAYQTMVRRCSTEHAPWHIIPADSKTRRNAIVARLVRGTLEAMNPISPPGNFEPGQYTIS
ncbi:MAG: polyphosphate kinase 2 family protein, partial [Pseudomonadota bacterium]